VVFVLHFFCRSIYSMSIPSFRIAVLTTEFVLDENAAYTRILGEVRSDGGERLYAYGPEGFAAQLAVGGGVEYPLLDGLGSVRQLIDAGGTVILTRSYDAYGSVRFTAGTGATRLGYTGELHDPASGLVYLRARHYHPVLGRFLQRDSFGGFVKQPQSLNRYAYAEGNPVVYVDPSGHCPAPPKSSGNVICVAGFIPTKESEGGPWGSIIYQGDDRDFSPDSTGRSSRFYAWIDADTGQFIGEPYVHPTVQLEILWIIPWCFETQPREWNNYFYVHKQTDGVIYFTYSVVCSSPACYVAPGPEGEILFAPNDYGSYDTYGSIEAFPNLEAYHWQNSRLVSPYLFQLQNFSPGELGNDMAGFGTGLNMYDLWPWGHRDFESHTVKQSGKWTVTTHVE
jgi:RHS repeat-associated protein